MHKFLLFLLLFSFSLFAEESVQLELFLGQKVSLPANLEIDEVEKIGSQLNIAGKSQSNQEIASFMKSLEKASVVNKVDLLSAKSVKENEKKIYQFKLLAKLQSTTSVKKRRQQYDFKNFFNETEKAQLDKILVDINGTGSNIAYAMFLQKKQELVSKKPTSEREEYLAAKNRYQDPYDHTKFQYNLSKLSLKSQLYGGLPINRRNHLSREIALLTAERAIDETLQLESIGTGPRDNEGNRNVALDSVEKLQVETHPWKEMLKEVKKAKLSEIFNLVPADHFLVYFNNIEDFHSLERTTKKIAKSMRYVIQTEQFLSVRKKVAKRLGVENMEALEPLIDEIVFISEDLSFFPRTEYALVIKFKDPQFNRFASFFSANNKLHKSIENYYVVSSNETLLERIQATSEQKISAMKDELDFQYMASVLDAKRSGFSYLSEKFILKLVSPEYRINAARRNKAIEQLESLQYASYAYKLLNKKWPKNIKDISSKPLDAFTIKSDGQIYHADWGSFSELKAVSAVPIEMLTKAEANDYGRFRRGYQNFWTRFFDPIGISLTVADKILIHTMILPLINNSDYNWLKDLTAAADRKFKYLKNVFYDTPLRLNLKLNFDNLVINLYKRSRRHRDKSNEQVKQEINSSITDSLKSKEAINIFGLLGRELAVGFGRTSPLSLANIADIDFYLALQLNDANGFKEFFNRIYRAIFSQMRSRPRGIPFLQLSSEEPLRNKYKDYTYQLIPTGFVNLYYLFHDDYVYFAISQLSINKIIDRISEKKRTKSEEARVLDFVGTNHHAILQVDTAEFAELKNDFNATFNNSYTKQREYKNLGGYLRDLELINQALNQQDRFEEVVTLPKEAYGLPIKLKDSQVFIGEHALKNLQFESRYQRYNKNNNAGKEDAKTKFHEIVPILKIEDLKESLQLIQKFALGLSFTEDGLESKISFNNPEIQN